MKKKIEAGMIVKGVLGDMKRFFPQWFPLVLKVSALWIVCQLLLYFVVGGSSLEGFLSEVSYTSLSEPVSEIGEEQSFFSHSVGIVFSLCVMVSGFFAHSSVGSGWLMYGRSGWREGGKSLPLWSGRGLSFLWMWIKFSMLLILILFLCVGIVWGIFISFLGFGPTGDLGFLLGGIVGVVMIVYVGMRCCLVFAGFARGESVGFFESWRGLKGFFVPLTGIGFFICLLLMLMPVLAELFFGFVESSVGGAGSFVSTGFGMVLFVLSLVVSATSMVMFMMVAERIDGVLREGG